MRKFIVTDTENNNDFFTLQSFHTKFLKSLVRVETHLREHTLREKKNDDADDFSKTCGQSPSVLLLLLLVDDDVRFC